MEARSLNHLDLIDAAVAKPASSPVTIQVALLYSRAY